MTDFRPRGILQTSAFISCSLSKVLRFLLFPPPVHLLKGFSVQFPIRLPRDGTQHYAHDVVIPDAYHNFRNRTKGTDDGLDSGLIATDAVRLFKIRPQ